MGQLTEVHSERFYFCSKWLQKLSKNIPDTGYSQRNRPKNWVMLAFKSCDIFLVNYSVLWRPNLLTVSCSTLIVQNSVEWILNVRLKEEAEKHILDWRGTLHDTDTQKAEAGTYLTESQQGGWWPTLRQADSSTARQSPSLLSLLSPTLPPVKPSATQLHRHFLFVKDTRVLLDKINCRE